MAFRRRAMILFEVDRTAHWVVNSRRLLYGEERGDGDRGNGLMANFDRPCLLLCIKGLYREIARRSNFGTILANPRRGRR